MIKFFGGSGWESELKRNDVKFLIVKELIHVHVFF